MSDRQIETQLEKSGSGVSDCTLEEPEVLYFDPGARCE
jgi:hypothetical protein